MASARLQALIASWLGAHCTGILFIHTCATGFGMCSRLRSSSVRVRGFPPKVSCMRQPKPHASTAQGGDWPIAGQSSFASSAAWCAVSIYKQSPWLYGTPAQDWVCAVIYISVAFAGRVMYPKSRLDIRMKLTLTIEIEVSLALPKPSDRIAAMGT